jgi:hypothetical protein
MSLHESEKSQYSYANPPEQPSIVGEIRFVMQDPRFTLSDRIEYAAHWLVTIAFGFHLLAA